MPDEAQFFEFTKKDRIFMITFFFMNNLLNGRNISDGSSENQSLVKALRGS